ncbi:hypothetical protein P692DRAFT_20785734, partial [Suillus brevipes Sb2]
MAGDLSSLILIDVDLTKVVQSDELVFEIIASMIHMGLCYSSTSSSGWSLTFEPRARNGRAPKVVVRMPQAVILTLLSWSGVSMILTRKPESTRLHQRCRCYTVVTWIRSHSLHVSNCRQLSRRLARHWLTSLFSSVLIYRSNVSSLKIFRRL